MPKLKLTDDDLDARDLEDAEYEESEDYSYDGPEPPVGTILPGYIKKMWWTWTQEKEDGSGGDGMIVVLFVADETAGKYEGCVIWERIVLTKAAKFRWAPFLGVIGLTIYDVRQKTYITDDDESLGRPITHISDWYPGQDKDEAYARVVVGGHRYDGRWQLDAKKWLAYEAGEEPDDEDEADEDEAQQDTRSRRTRQAPARAGTRQAAAPSRSRRSQPDPDEDEGEEDEEAEQGGSRRGGRAASGGRSSSRTATRGTRAGTRAAPARGRGRGRGSDDDPPF